MAVMQGFTGKLSGKMGSAVFRVRDGAQIVSQYNPIVRNPKTKKQMDNRSGFKLMVQLAAILAPSMGLISERPARQGRNPRKGAALSQRNLFVKRNFPLVEYDANGAKVKVEDLKLTDSLLPVGQIDVDVSETTVSVRFDNIPDEVSKVQIAVVKVGTEDTPPQLIHNQTYTPAEGSVRVSLENCAAGSYAALGYGIIEPTEQDSTVNQISGAANYSRVDLTEREYNVATQVTETLGGYVVVD